MKNILFIFNLFFATICFSQDLKMIKATAQRINAGAYPRYTINYSVEIIKEKCFSWKIDSVVNNSTKKSVAFNIVKVDNVNAVSPNYIKIESYNKKDVGNYILTFASFKSMGSSGRPGAPEIEMIEEPVFSEGATIFYRNRKKIKKLLVKNFEKLETINAP